MINLIRNQPKRVVVPINRVGGFSTAITLAAQSPTGVFVNIDPQPGTDSLSILTLTAVGNAGIGQSQIVVTGNPPAKNNSVTLQINVIEETTTTTTLAPTTTTVAPTTTETPFTASAVIYTLYESGRQYRFRGEVTYNSSYPVEYSWYINDTGTTVYGQEIDYTFASSGTYVVSLSVRFANNQFAYSSAGPVVSGGETTTTTTVAPTTSTTTTTTTTTTTVDATKVDTYKTGIVSLYRGHGSSTSYQSTWTFANSLKNGNNQNVREYYSLDIYSVGTDPDSGGEMITFLGNIPTGQNAASIDITLTKPYNYGLEVNVFRGGVRIGTFTIAKSSIDWVLGQGNTENIPAVWTVRA